MIINMYITTKSLQCICFIVLFINKASPQETVQGFVGSSALLPCHSSSQVLTVHWRYNDIKNVYDIQNGKESTKEQDFDYSGRTQMFPKEFIKGNFTLKLTNLKQSDEGVYCCFIPDSPDPKNVQQYITLQVKAVAVKPRQYQAGQAEPRNQTPEKKANKLLLLLILFITINIQCCI
ncbi:myelin-oligodendrocyte glycoprotein [Misgurnus anguillicaudatus]|uniref:myelin-oligodendrocyte glycoprotein n=1 Tax=Misgurnus anguillicaudatus TaxID=75329 RepID=UPI003CCF8612